MISAQPLNGHTPLNGEKEEGEVDEQDDEVLEEPVNRDVYENPQVCLRIDPIFYKLSTHRCVDPRKGTLGAGASAECTLNRIKIRRCPR